MDTIKSQKENPLEKKERLRDEKLIRGHEKLQKMVEHIIHSEKYLRDKEVLQFSEVVGGVFRAFPKIESAYTLRSIAINVYQDLTGKKIDSEESQNIFYMCCGFMIGYKEFKEYV